MPPCYEGVIGYSWALDCTLIIIKATGRSRQVVQYCVVRGVRVLGYKIRCRKVLCYVY